MAKQVSSSMTLFWCIAFPTIWIAFFSVFTLAIFVTNFDYYGGIPGAYMKIGIPIFLLVGMIFIKFTIMKLKRIDMDEESIYATNYFKTYKYSWESIEKIEERRWIIFNTAIIHLKTKGQFGKKIMFLLSKKRWADYIQANAFRLKDFVK